MLFTGKLVNFSIKKNAYLNDGNTSRVEFMTGQDNCMNTDLFYVHLIFPRSVVII